MVPLQLQQCILSLLSGVTLFALFQSGGILTADNLSDAKFTISSAFLFGTICAAVDPVAVRRCVW